MNFYQKLEMFYWYDWEQFFAITEQLMANTLGYVKDEVYEEV